MTGPNYSLARAAACRFSPPGPTAVVIITPPGRVITAVTVQTCHSSARGAPTALSVRMQMGTTVHTGLRRFAAGSN